MKLTLVLAGAVLGLALCRTVSAQEMTGAKLQEQCKAAMSEQSEDSFKSGFCYGFIRGVVDSGDRCMLARPDKTYFDLFTYCMPEGVTLKQSGQVVVKFLDDHPERLHLPAHTLVNAAFKSAFPCSAKPSTP